RARTAVAAVAAIFGAGQVRRVAQRPQQGRLRVELVVDRLAVDGHPRHGPRLARGGRRCQDGAMARITTSDGRAIGYAEAGVDELLAQPASPDVRGEVIETMARIDPTAFRIGAQAVWLADQSDRAGEIRVPTLVLCGEQDHVTPSPLSRALTHLIPGA